jgi:hypothetical protein
MQHQVICFCMQHQVIWCAAPSLSVTRAGFKLFSRDAVRVLFGTLHLERWGFDLEIIHLCDRLGLPMVVRCTVFVCATKSLVCIVYAPPSHCKRVHVYDSSPQILSMHHQVIWCAS